MGNQMHICTSKAQCFNEDLLKCRAADLNLEYGYEKFRVYKCNCCGGYHLTTQKK